MAETKDSYLDGSYFGPPIPSTQTGLRNRSRRRRLDCEPYNLLCTLFKVLTTILIVLGIIILVLWLIYQPDDLKAYVDNATLTRFDLEPNNTLYYNLTIDLSIRNPNKRYRIYYKRIEADVFYGGSRLDFEILPTFHQDRKSTVILRPNFQGQAMVPGDSVNVTTFNREKGEGYFDITLKMYTKLRLKMIVVKSVEFTPEMDCYLRIPMPANATSAGNFTQTKCHVDSFM